MYWNLYTKHTVKYLWFLLFYFCDRNFVGKQSELQNCETNAVQTCSLGGHEPEYVTFTRKKFEAKKKCLKGN